MNKFLQLPPGLDNTTIQATLTITFPNLIYTRFNMTSIQSSFKFWGQQVSHRINWNGKSQFNFIQYLKDMKILIVQFKDIRTNILVAMGILNFSVMLNGFQWINGEWNVNIEQKKKKVGEFLIKLQYKQLASTHVQQIENVQTNERIIESSKKSLNQNKQQMMINRYNNVTLIPQNRQQTYYYKDNININSIQNIESLNQNKPKGKKDVLQQFRQLGLLGNKQIISIPSTNYQFQASKLRLHQLELFGSELVSNCINIIFSHLIDTKSTFQANYSFQLTIQIPIIVNKQSKINTFNIWSINSQKNSIQFNQKISLVIQDKNLTNQQLKQYLSSKVKIKLLEVNKQVAKQRSRCEIRLSELLSGLKRMKMARIPLIKKTKQNKEQIDCQLILKQESNYEQQTIDTTIVKSQNNIVSNHQTKIKPEISCVQTKSIPFQLIIYIGKIHFVKTLFYQDFYLRLKIDDNTFKSQSFWKTPQPTFDMLLHIPIPPNHKLNFLILQLWSNTSQEQLIATTKIQIDKLNNFVEVPNGCMIGNSLLPYVYIDQSRQVKTLKDALIGYLQIKLAIGTAQQGFNFDKQIKQLRNKNARKKIHKNNENNQIEVNIPTQQNVIKNDYFRVDDNINVSQQSSISQLNQTSHNQISNSSSKNHIIDQIQEIPSTLSTTLFETLFEISKNQNYYKFLDILMNKTSSFLSMGQFVTLIKDRLNIKLSEFQASRISFFLVTDLKIITHQFTKCIQSYRQYQQLLNDEYNTVINSLKQKMQYQMISANLLQLHLKKYTSGGQYIKKTEFKQALINLFEISLSEMDKLFELFKSTEQQLLISKMIDALRKYDLFSCLKQFKYSSLLFSTFMFSQLCGILQQIPEVLEFILASCQNTKDNQIFNSHQLVDLFQGADIELSLFEAFVVIQCIKKNKNQTKLDQGLISKQLIVSWLQKLMPSRIFRSPTFGLIHNKQPNKIKNNQTQIQSSLMYKKIGLQFSFPIKPISVKLFGEEVSIEQQSIHDIIIYTTKLKSELLIIQIATKDQILNSQGRINQWTSVFDEENYVGDVYIQ